MAYGLEQSMRILPSWSTVMNENVGSMIGLTTVDVQPINRIDRLPIRPRGSAQRVHTKLQVGAANGVDVDDVLQIAHIGQNEVFLVRARGIGSLCRTGCALPLGFPARNNSFARSCTQPVTSVSAGPPLGGLYLKPPSSGGLCDGVMTMPSAK